MFSVSFETDNEAFHKDACGDEVARILRKLADRLEGDPMNEDDGGNVLDGYGNTVGRWTYVAPPPPDPVRLTVEVRQEGDGWVAELFDPADPDGPPVADGFHADDPREAVEYAFERVDLSGGE